MTNEGFQLYTERLKAIRDAQTQPNKIKFIDDILSALKYKDSIIDDILAKQYSIVHKATQDYFDVKLKLEGCALRYGIPGWEIEKWLRMTPEQAIREVKYWQDYDKRIQEVEHLINGTTPPTIETPKPTRIAKKPLLNWKDGIPNVPFKPMFSLNEIVNNSQNQV